MVDEKAKSPILLIAIIIISLILTGGLFYLFQNEHKKAMDLQADLELVKTSLKVAEGRLEDSQRTISNLNVKIQEANGKIDKFSSDLRQEQALRQEAQNQVEQLRADLDRQTSLKAELEGKLTKLQKDASSAEDQLKDLLSKKTDLENRLGALEAQAKNAQDENVELGKVVVSPDSGAQAKAEKPAATSATTVASATKEAKAAAEGKVLVINKDYNFVVINLGNKDGINVGDVFSIYRNNKYVGDAKVEKVHDSMSAAGVSADLKDKVNEGDKVVRKA
jgi:membrane protein involved in colicin uptake